MWTMEDKRVLIGDNHHEDVRWLHSLSEPEIDLLIGLKDIAVQRAKVIGQERLSDKFDLKLLRALSYILMQHVKGQLSNLQLTGVDKLKEMLEGGNLLKLDLERQDEDNNQSSGDETLSTYMEIAKKRRRGTKSNERTPTSKRDKKDERTSTDPK
ncbi:hypothetical protein RND81_10G189700 [Saponaria officinalis]|uniref:Uncharacterized protein n=1 Tax=Saponaria officinalis TaxID=3572 RepID=A0AAW1I6C9_SAPOF